MSLTSGFDDEDDSTLSVTNDLPSIRAQIEALDVGETYSRAQRFDADTTLKAAPVEAMRAMRLSMQATVFRIGERTGNKYTIESGEFRTQSRDVMACLCITRIA